MIQRMTVATRQSLLRVHGHNILFFFANNSHARQSSAAKMQDGREAGVSRSLSNAFFSDSLLSGGTYKAFCRVVLFKELVDHCIQRTIYRRIVPFLSHLKQFLSCLYQIHPCYLNFKAHTALKAWLIQNVLGHFSSWILE